MRRIIIRPKARHYNGLDDWNLSLPLRTNRPHALPGLKPSRTIQRQARDDLVPFVLGGVGMSDSIFVRVQRVVSGGVGSAIDAAERLSGTSVMRQAIRDMDSAIEKARGEREGARARRLQAEHHPAPGMPQAAGDAQGAGALRRSASTASDLAEAAIARQLDVETQIASLTKAGDRGESRRGIRLERQRRPRSSFAAARCSRNCAPSRRPSAPASTDFEAPTSPESRLQRRAERAEEAFERALAAAGGLSGGRATPRPPPRSPSSRRSRRKRRSPSGSPP